jgi:hypothetical protein
MGHPKLSAPRVRVIREGHEDLEIQCDNRDMIRWDRTRVKHRWGKADDEPIVWLTFIAWAAATRTGATDDTYATWESIVLDVTPLDEDTEAPDEAGDPTQPGPDPG